MHQDGLMGHILAKAAADDMNPALIAVQYDLPVKSPELWWNPSTVDDFEDVYIDNVDLLSGGHDDVLTKFCSSISESIQFPASTVFLHGLGVVSAAMVENFYYCFNGSTENTVALYTVGAQPPSTGKSSVDSYLTEPVHEAYNTKRDEGELTRKKLKRKIAATKKEIEKSKIDAEAEELERELLDLENDLKKCPDYTWCVNDPTPEGCEKILAKQNGFFNVVSDESSAVAVVLGMVYSDKAKNNGVFLKAWDNGYLSVARAGRDGFTGRIRGSMAILAQDASVNTILQAGQSGEGISERFLILREPNNLGLRDHTQYKPINQEARSEYNETIKRIVSEPEPVYFRLSEASENMVRDIKQEQEPLMRDGGRYSSSMLRGVVGKNEKQIIKIACVLHAVQEWSPSGSKKTTIEITTIIRAVHIFNQLLKTYVAAADSKGFTGQKTEINKIIDMMVRAAGKNKLQMDMRTFRNRIKDAAPFNSMERLTEKIKKDYIPILEANGYAVWDERLKVVHINPKLRG